MITISTTVFVLLLVVAFMVGVAATMGWLRARVTVDRLANGKYALRLGRAVLGVWGSLPRARSHADALRRQIGGTR